MKETTLNLITDKGFLECKGSSMEYLTSMKELTWLEGKSMWFQCLRSLAKEVDGEFGRYVVGIQL